MKYAIYLMQLNIKRNAYKYYLKTIFIPREMEIYIYTLHLLL